MKKVYKGFSYSVDLSKVSVYKVILFVIDLILIFGLIGILLLNKDLGLVSLLVVAGMLIGLFFVVTPLISVLILGNSVKKYKSIFYTVTLSGIVILAGYILSAIFILSSLNPVLDMFRLVIMFGCLGMLIGGVGILILGSKVSKHIHSGDKVIGTVVGYMPYNSTIVRRELLSTGVNILKKYQNNTYYAMQVRYFYKGIWYTCYDSYAYDYKNIKTQGDNIELYVDKLNPRKIYVPVVNYKYFYGVSAVLLVFCIVFLIIDIVLWLI